MNRTLRACLIKELQVCYISMLFEIKHITARKEGCSVLVRTAVEPTSACTSGTCVSVCEQEQTEQGVVSCSY